MIITWFGTASLAVQTQRGRLLIDPFFPFPGSPTHVPSDAYDGYVHILVTHGHFDHILSLPLLCHGEKRRIHCTQTPFDTLKNLGVTEDSLVKIAPGDTFPIDDMRVTACQSRHVKFDRIILRRTLLSPRMLRHARNLPRAIRGFREYPENGETLGFLIEAEGARVFAMGSLNLAPNVEYPTDMDLLVLPYQGTSDLLTPAIRIIDRLKPKAVLLDHWDDAFPPISNTVDTSGIQEHYTGKLPIYRLEPGQSFTL